MSLGHTYPYGWKSIIGGSGDAISIQGKPVQSYGQSNNDVMQYNASTGTWDYKSVSEALGGSIAGSNNQLIRYDGTTGYIKNSSVLVDDTGILSISNTTDTSSSITGALTVAGGVGIAKGLHVQQELEVVADILVGGAIYGNGEIRTTDSGQSSSAGTGSIQTLGGIGVAKSIYCAENVIIPTAPTLNTHATNKLYVDNTFASGLFPTTPVEVSLQGTHPAFVSTPPVLNFRGFKIGQMAFINIRIDSVIADSSSSGYIQNNGPTQRFPAGFTPRIGHLYYPVFINNFVNPTYPTLLGVQELSMLEITDDGDWIFSGTRAYGAATGFAQTTATFGIIAVNGQAIGFSSHYISYEI